jgi:predicted Zn-dependent protease
LARAIGASDAAVEVSEGVGLSVSIRKGETENVERNRDKSMGIWGGQGLVAGIPLDAATWLAFGLAATAVAQRSQAPPQGK